MALWQSRWTKSLNKDVEDFTFSLSFDKRLWEADLIGTCAHVLTLKKIGMFTSSEMQILRDAMLDLNSSILTDPNIISDAEDIHTFIEEKLTQKIGDIGKKIHTGRSRNDQVAMDFRLYLREEVCEISSLLIEFRAVLLDLAKEHIDTVMPGFTHLQHAQPVTLGHYFLAYDSMFERDLERLEDLYKRLDVMPLGSGALAGSSIPLDREYTAKLLKFSKISQNSMDAVSDRDFALEFLFFASLTYLHLSRLAEEIILWSSQEFSFLTLPEDYSTGSSMMPHKRNPDVAELTRGKAGRIIGNLMDLFITLKALPLSYNKDLQEDKPLVFSAVDELKLAFNVWIGFLPKIEFHKENLKRFAEDSFLLATDLAEYLVLKGVPFREAHKIIGDLVRYCEEKKKNFNELKIDEWKTFSPFFEEDVFDLLSPEKSVNAKKTFGSPNPKINLKVLETKLSSLESLKEEWEERRNNLPNLEELLSKFL